mgnify:CR=1 FL=1
MDQGPIDYQTTLRNLKDYKDDLLFTTGNPNEYSISFIDNNNIVNHVFNSTHLADNDKEKIRKIAEQYDLIAYENRTQGTRQRKIGKGKRKMHSKCKKCKSKLRRKSRK